MRVMATITDPAIAQRILACLELPPRAPPHTAASSAGCSEFEPDREVLESHFDLIPPEFDFDQRPPDDGSGDTDGET
jgi:hypothetical protein